MENQTENKTSAEKVAAELKHARELKEKLQALHPAATNVNSTQDRLKTIANRPDEPEMSVDKKNNKDRPMGLKELTEKSIENGKKIEAAGLTSYNKNKLNEKNSPSKEKDNDKNKDKEENKKENTPEKQEQKMAEMFSKVNLPSGMELHQQASKWILVSKDGKQQTDVTDVMTTIDKFNKNVDAVNKTNQMQNAVQSGVDKAADITSKNGGAQINDTSKMQVVSEALPSVKDVNGSQVFKPEDIQKVAETAINFSNEKSLLEKLKDPKALEEMRKREKNNENKADRQAQQKQNMLQMRQAKAMQRDR